MKKKMELLLPFTLTLAVVALDQITKMAVLKVAETEGIVASFFGDFLRIILVYNTGAAFSFGRDFAPLLHFTLLKLIPLLVILAFLPFYFKMNLTRFERWLICGVIGGGIGNLLDRFFRINGVIDFIDVKFYGLFGLERWPTFNVADSVVVICFSLLIIYNIFKKKGDETDEKTKNK